MNFLPQKFDICRVVHAMRLGKFELEFFENLFEAKQEESNQCHKSRTLDLAGAA